MPWSGCKNEITIGADNSSYRYYRLKLINQTGIIFYSKEIEIFSRDNSVITWPNPVKENFFIKITTACKGHLSYAIINSNGTTVSAANIEVINGEQTLSIPAANLKAGFYYFRMNGLPLQEPVFFRLIKS
jgi:hypothetical protein